MRNIDSLQEISGISFDITDFLLATQKHNFDIYYPLTIVDVMFNNDNIILNDEVYPLGTFSTVALNFVQDENLFKLYTRFLRLYSHYQLLKHDIRITLEDLLDIEDTILDINKALKPLMIYNKTLDKEIDLKSTYEFFINTIKRKDLLKKYMEFLLRSYISINDDLINFYENFFSFSENVVTEMSSNLKHDYAKMFDKYFYDLYHTIEIKYNYDYENINKFIHKDIFGLIEKESTFKTYKLPNSKDKLIVESIIFKSYISLLQYDYFKALQNNHTVRICRNCNRAFLQLTKHHTAYCDRIAPNELNKTCREIGATLIRKEKIKNSPIHDTYNKAYRRIYQRYNRKTITLDEFNSVIIEIQNLKNKALSGEITVINFQQLVKNF